MPRGKWTPTPELAARLEALRAMREAADKAAADAEDAIKAEVVALKAAGVPITTLARTLGVGRKKTYGLTGKKMR